MFIKHLFGQEPIFSETILVKKTRKNQKAHKQAKNKILHKNLLKRKLKTHFQKLVITCPFLPCMFQSGKKNTTAFRALHVCHRFVYKHFLS